jgi:hypothetical protein
MLGNVTLTLSPLPISRATPKLSAADLEPLGFHSFWRFKLMYCAEPKFLRSGFCQISYDP